MDDFKIRMATIDDIPFLVETIIEAEKSGTDKLSYSTIFGLSEEEVWKYLSDIFKEEIPGCELSISSFMVAENEGNIAGALSAWIEGQENIPSSLIKGNLINYTLPKECIASAISLNSMIHELNIDYNPGTIVIGAGYVSPEFRGKGLLPLLIEKQIDHLSRIRPDIIEVNAQIFESNTSSLRSVRKLGFLVAFVRESSNKDITKFLPSNKKIFIKKILT